MPWAAAMRPATSQVSAPSANLVAPGSSPSTVPEDTASKTLPHKLRPLAGSEDNKEHGDPTCCLHWGQSLQAPQPEGTLSS